MTKAQANNKRSKARKQDKGSNEEGFEVADTPDALLARAQEDQETGGLTAAQVAARVTRRVGRSSEGDEIFFEKLAEAWPVSYAAAWAGYARGTVYEWRLKDAKFRESWDNAVEAGNDYMRQEIRRRGVHGWLEPVYQGGKLVGYVRKFSDKMLELAARGRMPSEFGNQLNVSGGLTVDVREVPDAKLNHTIAQLLSKGGLSAHDVERFKIPELPTPQAPVIDAEFEEVDKDKDG